MKCQDLINYYIIDKKSGKTFTPDVCMEKYLTAYSNIATDKTTFIIIFSKLIKGLKERRYRLIERNIY